MEPERNFQENARAIRKMLSLIFVFFALIGGMLIYLLIDPGLTAFRPGPEIASVAVAEPETEEDFDKIVVRVMWADQGPVWRINEQPATSLIQLRSQLEAIARARGQRLI